jgi:cytochrome c553
MKLKYALIAGLAVLCFVGLDVPANETAKGQCAACHGPDGNSINPEWPNLAGQHPKYVVQQLRAFKSGQRENPNMSAMVSTLSEEDMVALGAFYATQKPQIGTIEVEQIAAGEKLYRGGDKDKGIPACMACHGPNGAGNPAANYPALSGQQAKYTSIQLQAYRSGDRKAGQNQPSIMQTIAVRMSDDDIANVARYVRALH